MTSADLTASRAALSMAFAVLAAAAVGVAPADAATARREAAGTLPGGEAIEAVELEGANGVSARILTYGATLQALRAPDRAGRNADVIVGYDTAAQYVEQPNFLGVTVGRVANRIARGQFKLDGQTYQLAANSDGNALHGGVDGFDKRNWRIVSMTPDGARAGVTMALRSPDGDQGYPGRLDVQVTYMLDDNGSLTITFEGRPDRPTIVNMTNHAIFNLAGEGSPRGAMGQQLTIPATHYTPVDATLIPTGALRPVTGSVFDFTVPRTIADGLRDGTDRQIVYGHGYDHNFALDKGLTREPELAARLEDPDSGRVLEVLTTEPGVQVYTTNFFDGTVVGKNNHVYRMGDGVALEPQKFPDAINQPAFASPRVDPANPYRHVMIYRMSVAR